LAITPVSRWVVHSFGLLGFIAVLVHRMSLWTSGGALVVSVTLSLGLDRSEGVSARASEIDSRGLGRAGNRRRRELAP
jgi:hypothetical protein